MEGLSDVALNRRFHTIRIRGVEIEAFVSASSIDMSSDASTRVSFSPRSEPIFVDTPNPLVAVRFGIVNQGLFYVIETGRGLRPNHLALTADGWSIAISPISDGQFGDLSSIEDPIHKITHAAELTRIDGSEFTAQAAHEMLDVLAMFFSFSRGRWVAPALVHGLDKTGAVAMEEWGTRRLHYHTDGATWFDRMHGESLVDLFPGFVDRLADADWKESISAAIYWYTRTNNLSAGPDGALVLIQAALERLAWEALVRTGRVLSQDGFGRLPASDQLRLLLERSQIPLEIPTTLRELAKSGKRFKWDGPQAFVEIRNAIVHPPKLRQNARAFPIYEGWLLGAWYLELVLLRLFNFQGQYSNRTREVLYVGEVEPVPWKAT